MPINPILRKEISSTGWSLSDARFAVQQIVNDESREFYFLEPHRYEGHMVPSGVRLKWLPNGDEMYNRASWRLFDANDSWQDDHGGRLGPVVSYYNADNIDVWDEEYNRYKLDEEESIIAGFIRFVSDNKWLGDKIRSDFELD